MRTANGQSDRVRNEHRGCKSEACYCEPFTIASGDIVRVGHSNESLAASDEFDHRPVAIDKKRFACLQSAAPIFPGGSAPMLTKREEVRCGGAEERISQSDFARHCAIGEALQIKPDVPN